MLPLDNHKVLDEFEFGQIRLWTAELAALERLKKSFTFLRTIQNIFMTGERSFPFGLLVYQYFPII